MNEFTISFSSNAEPIEVQLNKQGYTLDGDFEYQRLVDAVELLWGDNIITSTEKLLCRKRLVKRIRRAAKLME